MSSKKIGKKGLLLLSSGIDSPVAGYLMLRQGAEIVAVHFQNSESENKETSIALERIVARLSELSKKEVKLIVVNNFGNEKMIAENTNRRFQCLLCKRMMYRVAERLAEENGCDFLVTGENLGQVASQTVENLSALNEAVNIPILRPLLCNDKNETIKIAEEIGTFSLSIKAGKCPFVPNSPLTAAKLDEVKYEESKLDIAKMADVSVASAKNPKNSYRLEG